ncbi:MAG: 4-hydroxy-tetrahydrodipicolinate synthase [Patescibacteria group bacterium]|nr:4-hydroxy-tetrahydrodipicolinate synthase [Patescibacteria group bacterium]
MTKRKYAGTWTALITPFKKDGSLDEEALRALIRQQIEGGVTGVVPSGTTGESPTMTPAEDTRAAEIVVEESKGRVMVMAGTGSNCTWEAVEYTKNAKAAGADCCLVVAPYYNKPTPEGLKRHYTAIADVGLPVIVYNIKGRTGINIDTDTLMAMAQHPMIAGVKEASGDIEQMKEVIARRPDDFTVLSGDDGMTLALMKAGGDGVISVASNIIPSEVSAFVKHAQDGAWEEAERMNTKLSDMFKKLFIESNPVPVKYCAHRMGLCELSYRLPMCEPTEKSRKVLDAMLKEYGLSA